MMKTAIILGTRPEIIKLSPIIRLTKKRNTEIIFTGQHYDYEMGLKFMNELGLPKPDYHLKITKNDPTKQIAEIIQKLSKIFRDTSPDTVLIQGDTNTALAGAISSIKSKIPVCHIEAGIRSFDWRMPEEHNRIVADHLSEFLFAPTQISKRNLLNESVHGKIFVTGNTAIDAIKYNLSISQRKNLIDAKENDFLLVTLHRAENVDDKKILSGIIKALLNSNEKIIFPVHPRTKKRLVEFSLWNKIKNSKKIILMKPLGTFDMLMMMQKCNFIITDSGGIQEEATSPQIKKKVIVIRKTTDRPESVLAGMADLVGIKSESILKSIKRNISDPTFPKKPSPYGNGNAAKKILKIIDSHF